MTLGIGAKVASEAKMKPRLMGLSCGRNVALYQSESNDSQTYSLWFTDTGIIMIHQGASVPRSIGPATHRRRHSRASPWRILQGCRGYGDSHGDSHGYGYGMGVGTV